MRWKEFTKLWKLAPSRAEHNQRVSKIVGDHMNQSFTDLETHRYPLQVHSPYLYLTLLLFFLLVS